MLTNEEIDRYKLIQSKGLPLSQDLISIREATKIVGRTFGNITLVKAKKPGHNEQGCITWWIVGSIIMMDKASLIKVAVAKGWIEEVS